MKFLLEISVQGLSHYILDFVYKRFIQRRIMIILCIQFNQDITNTNNWKTETVLFYLVLIYYCICTSTPGRRSAIIWHTTIHVTCLYKWFEQTHTSIFLVKSHIRIDAYQHVCQIKSTECYKNVSRALSYTWYDRLHGYYISWAAEV